MAAVKLLLIVEYVPSSIAASPEYGSVSMVFSPDPLLW